MRLKVTVDGVAYDVEVEVEEEHRAPLGAIFMGGGFVPQHAAAASAAAADAGGGGGDEVKAPLAGTVVRIPAKEGAHIDAGDVLVVLEAMKMETEITASAAGMVQAVLVSVGDTVAGGAVMVRVEPDE